MERRCYNSCYIVKIQNFPNLKYMLLVSNSTIQFALYLLTNSIQFLKINVFFTFVECFPHKWSKISPLATIVWEVKD